ncbi:23S rRNA (pseudouridine(1915)-N(3))-methyltransferase RlmH [Patescibacteria group bacterium]|nr:23S rRNA (pseudouridine(1915)-N(3))-methyltransferase RlmH [Patescibacteria group bacterium]MBU1629611.1 23S rRNA (pseudouridine(1915)-N(3))-methyltransferase RlmH [Patescibacteria group bacterium]MBU1907877.1 23S rRNA (pseudouridine(1915)-N(3))-methyltransferase RlmH [Patescibacteria group bacterium]
MSIITIKAVGKLTEDWQKQAIFKYEKFLRPHFSLNTIELPDGHKGTAKPDISKTKSVEADALLKGILQDTLVVALNASGKQYDSHAFASQLTEWSNRSRNIVFLIGGSWGLDEKIFSRANAVLSLGKLTLPHALARIVLLEQLYRAETIIRGGTYHK